jgi:phenylalanine-4-hydroxylase
MGALERGDDRTAYAAMNRFMEMLEAREHGIAPVLADWLLDYCYLVTPAKYHDVSRHIRKIAQPVS